MRTTSPTGLFGRNRVIFTLKSGKKIVDQGIAGDLVSEDLCGNPGSASLTSAL